MATPSRPPLRRPDARPGRAGRSITGADVTNFPLTNLDLTNFDIAAILASDPAKAARAAIGLAATAAREATYVTVGLTVLGLQRARSKRHDAGRDLRHSSILTP
jgi:hypothetical protein